MERAQSTHAEIEKRLQGIHTAVFDLDGTLFDSLGLWDDIDRRFLAKRGIDLPPDYMQAVTVLEFRAAAEYTIERFSLSDTPEALMAEWTEMAREAYATEIPLKAGAAAFLTDLAARGWRLAIATSCTPDLYLPALARTGIATRFAAVATTGEAGRGKRFPDVFLAAAKALDVSPRSCVVFEDSPAALDCARRAGFVTVCVSDPHVHTRPRADLYLDTFDGWLPPQFLR